MEIIGIICEYNPLHNGHIYHIKKIKELFPDSLIILVLNGYFLERGEMSILSKEDKTRLALQNQIDIVLELPFIYGIQSADTFANIALKILNNFHVTKLIFGSETNNINQLKLIANKQLESNYNEKVQNFLSDGLNYPTALAKSLNIDFNFQPNDLLGISYTKAIIINQYPIEPITIKRTNDYHDKTSNEIIISATNIREKIKNNINITKYIPHNVNDHLIKLNYLNYFKLLKYKILTDIHLNNYLDVDEGIEYRLKKFITKANNLEDFISLIKTKRYTYNKINRMLTHILVSLPKNLSKELDYIKILGFNKKGQNYLNSFDKFDIATIVNKNSLQYKFELQASIIYDLINNTNTNTFEKNNKPIIVK